MALTNLKEIYKDRGRNFIENLFTKYIIISEQLDGSRFTVMRSSDGTLTFCKKDGSVINMIDRTMMVFYETAIQHFNDLDMDAVLKMPDNWEGPSAQWQGVGFSRGSPKFLLPPWLEIQVFRQLQSTLIH